MIIDTLVCILAQNPMVIFAQNDVQVKVMQHTHLTRTIYLLHNIHVEYL